MAGIVMLNLEKAKKGLVEKLGAISHFHCPFLTAFYHALCGHKRRANPDKVSFLLIPQSLRDIISHICKL